MTPFELNIRQQDGRHQRIRTLLSALAELFAEQEAALTSQLESIESSLIEAQQEREHRNPVAQASRMLRDTWLISTSMRSGRKRRRESAG